MSTEEKKEEEKKEAVEETVSKKDFEELGKLYFQNQVIMFEAYKILKDVGHNMIQMGSAIQEHQQKYEQPYAVAVSEVLSRIQKQQKQAQQQQAQPTN